MASVAHVAASSAASLALTLPMGTALALPRHSRNCELPEGDTQLAGTALLGGIAPAVCRPRTTLLPCRASDVISLGRDVLWASRLVCRTLIAPGAPERDCLDVLGQWLSNSISTRIPFSRSYVVSHESTRWSWRVTSSSCDCASSELKGPTEGLPCEKRMTRVVPLLHAATWMACMRKHADLEQAGAAQDPWQVRSPAHSMWHA